MGKFKNFKLNEAAELTGKDALIAYSAANNASYKADFIGTANAAIDETKNTDVLTRMIAEYAK